ncbi:MAG: methylmalonyl-CoA mutase family protein [Bacteroidetes bacterium]|nr:methylmalonyl-CoA mutase family protein [Bacteroidota bacterium]
MSSTKSKKYNLESGIEIHPTYFPSSKNNIEEFPGEYPFTRGIHSKMYRSKLWTMRQYAGFGSAEESNKRYKYLLAHGTTGLSVAFDLPTQMGYDSDHQLAEGEVGKVGVAIDTLADMEILFKDIKLENISTSMTINSTAAILLAMYVALAKKESADLKKINGTIQNDILKEYIARGTYIYPPTQSMRLVTDIFSWCSQNLNQFNTISISGYHIREAGSTAVQEVAFTMANAIEYVNAAIKSGLTIDSFASRISFFFNSHNNIFEEIAKFRAARRIWASILKNNFGCKNPESLKMRFHVQTGGSTLTAQQIENNITRTSLQALSAVLGGCQSLHVNSKDEALALPTESAARTALRTQQIIAHELGISNTVDPLGGSYFVESLTSEIETKVQEYLQKIDSLGGAVRAIEKEYYQTEISNSAYNYQKQIDAKEKIIVGVNDFIEKEADDKSILKIDNSLQLKQITSLKKIKSGRDNQKVKENLSEIEKCANGNENLIPKIISAVESYATIGEISDTLRKVWGEYN